MKYNQGQSRLELQTLLEIQRNVFMKIKAICPTLLTISAVLFAEAFPGFAIDPPPQRSRSYDIDPDIRNEANRLTTMEQRCAYLATVVTNTPGSHSTNRFKVASAIRLLDAIHSTNLIPVLISQIDFMDHKYNNYPAMPALAALGEAAVPQLLEAVKKPKRSTWARNAVETLMDIKGPKYIEFVEGQKNILSPDAWKRLSWYAFHSEVPPTVSIYPLPQQVCGYEIETNVFNEVNMLPTVERRCAYLASVVTNTTDSTAEDNFKIASAIRLLGVLHSTNSIAVLVARIDFEDAKYRNNPTVLAMAAMGEPAVSQLMAVVNEPKSSRRVRFAVETLMEIKGSKYNEFVGEQKNNLSIEVWKRLLQYAIDW